MPKLRKTESSCLGINLYHLYVSPGTLKISVSITTKKFRFFQGFVKKSNFADVASDYMSRPINAKHDGYQKCKIN